MKIWPEKDPKTNKKIWRGDGRVAGRRYYPKGETKKEVEDIFAALRVKARAKRYGLVTEQVQIKLADFFELYIKDLDLSLRQRRFAKRIIENFLDHLPTGYTFAELSTADFSAYFRRRQKESLGIKDTSLNNELKFVTKALRAAGEYFPALADYRLPRVGWQRAAKGQSGRSSSSAKGRTISEHEEQALLNHLRTRPREKGEQKIAAQNRQLVADMFEIALNTGMRWCEIVRLEIAHLDFQKKRVFLPAEITKTGQARNVPMNNRVLEILKMRAEKAIESNKRFVFASNRRDAPFGEYRELLRSEATKAGLAFGAKIANGFTAHTTRHTTTTRLLERGNDLGTVARLIGHSDYSMTLYYTHSTIDAQNKAVDSLIEKGAAENRIEQTKAAY